MSTSLRGGFRTLSAAALSNEQDFLPLKGTDHVEFYVGNARQAAYFYRAAFGMSLVAYAGPETGQRDRASYVLQQGKMRFVLTTPLRPSDPIAEHVHRMATRCAWSRCGWTMRGRRGEETTSRGAVSVAEPYCEVGREWDGGDGEHPDLWRHDPHVCGARRSTTGRSCRGIRAVRAGQRCAAGGAACTSTTWWATWAGTRWTSGWSSMRA